MADEVVIRLRGSSTQLEAALQRLSKNMDELGVKSRVVQSQIQTGSRRSSAAINEQNKSFTLMVAKLALVTFAVQTLANIFQNTFGAVLKNIDDFNLAAISTASAITSITSETNRPGIEVFNQNLQATKQTFEELEIVAADFFSSGAELQLAYNTLAQRGVIVREEEFKLLGKLTDQIKLLTGGQAADIQIQQELRSILDGNVRTTSAFGKALQARGVNITQLQRELQATGSLKPFEPFLTGLDSASGAIRRTLSSVLSTFGSLASILGRNIFEDTYDGVVASITRVNNFIIDQRDELIGVAKVLINDVKFAFEQIVRVVSTLGNILGDISTSGIGQLLLLIKALSLLSAGPFKTFAILAAVVFQLTGNLESASKALDVFFKAFRIGLNVVEKGLEALSDLNKLVQNFKLTVSALQNIDLLGKESNLEKQVAALTPDQLASSRGQRLVSELEKVRSQIIENVNSMEQTVQAGSAEAGADSGESFIDGLGKSLTEGLDKLEKELDEKTAQLGLTSGTDKIKAQFEELVRQAKALGKVTKVDTAETLKPTIVDSRIEEAELERARAAFDKHLSIENKARDNFFQQEIQRIHLLQAERTISGQQSFQRELAAKQESIRLDIVQLENQKKIIAERAKEDRAIINANLAATQGVTKLQEQEATVAIVQSLKKETEEILAVNQRINDLQNQSTLNALDAAKQTTEEYRKVNRILQDRNALLLKAGGLTNEERAANINLESGRLRADFAAENQASPEQIAAFNQQQDRLDFLASVQPQIDAFTKAIDDVFQTLIDGIVEGTFEFRDLANSLSKDLIKSGMQEFIAQAKDAVVKGFETIFEGLGNEAAAKSAQALALGIGILLAVLSKAGNKGDFTATGGGAGGSTVTGSRQVQGIIGGDTSIPIAEINIGLQEALIPTNSLLSQIERNTRSLADLNVNIDPGALQAALSAKLDSFFQQMVLQNP